MKNKITEKVLLISSANPTKGPGAIGKRIYDIMKEGGLNVDMLTLYQVNDLPEIRYIYGNDGIINKIRSIYRRYIKLIKRHLLFQPKVDGHYFFYRKESDPPVKSAAILRKIQKEYDLVIVYFWQDMLSFKTIQDIYDRLHCRFIFICVDYSPMTGGCHFTDKCENFKTGCGSCPAFKSSHTKDFTYKNVLYRKKVYENVKPVLWLNTYMKESFFEKAYLTKNLRLEQCPSTLNISFFKPLEVSSIRTKYNISENKKFIIAFGCQSLTDERKGMSYLIEALNFVYDKMSFDERNKTLLISIGNNGDRIKENLKLDYKSLGYIPIEKLPEFYSMASLFVGSSVNDAGPSMYAQALACGTPLVAFEMGAALDVLKDKRTGYCAKLRDSEDLAEGILSVIRMHRDEYNELRSNCRLFIESISSVDEFVKRVRNI